MRLQLASLEGRLNSKVVADWYPRLQKQSSTSKGDGGAVVLNHEPLRQEHLAFVKWDSVWFDLERHKREKAYYNVVFSPADLRALMKESWWYDLFIPPGPNTESITYSARRMNRILTCVVSLRRS